MIEKQCDCYNFDSSYEDVINTSVILVWHWVYDKIDSGLKSSKIQKWSLS